MAKPPPGSGGMVNSLYPLERNSSDTSPPIAARSADALPSVPMTTGAYASEPSSNRAILRVKW